jgi:hypothetical protein
MWFLCSWVYPSHWRPILWHRLEQLCLPWFRPRDILRMLKSLLCFQTWECYKSWNHIITVLKHRNLGYLQAKIIYSVQMELHSICSNICDTYLVENSYHLFSYINHVYIPRSYLWTHSTVVYWCRQSCPNLHLCVSLYTRNLVSTMYYRMDYVWNRSYASYSTQHV